jgi:hypothetical protein
MNKITDLTWGLARSVGVFISDALTFGISSLEAGCAAEPLMVVSQGVMHVKGLPDV